MSKQCRICFSSDDPNTLISPCDCRGTSAYIHIACLEEYFRHYPDRICRVCHEPMIYTTSFDKTMGILLFIWLSIMLIISNSLLLQKLFFFMMFIGILSFSTIRKFITAPVSILIISSSMILVTSSTKYIFSSLFLIGGILSLSTMIMFIPFQYIAIMITNLIIASYCILIIIFFAERNDIFITSCFLALIVFIWALIVHQRSHVR